MNPPVVPSVTLPRIEKPAKQSADIINFYFKSKEQVLLAVLVFIFSFCSVAEASITREDLAKRGVFVKCTNLAEYYSDNIAKKPKFIGFALKEKAQCNISKNQIAKAKKNLNAAIKAFPDDVESVYLLLQIKLEESISEGKPEVDLKLFEELTDKVKGDWPQRDYRTDSYYYIQEVANLLTPYLILVIYDFVAAIEDNGVGLTPENAKSDLSKMIDFVGGNDGCISLLDKVHNKIKQHEIESKSRIAKPIGPKAYEVYSNRVNVVKEEVCSELEQMKVNPYSPPLEDNPDETL